jgi:hypothetical protein
MSWMSRYVLPTTEFWTWSTASIDIDPRTRLAIKLIGLGWVIMVSSTTPCSREAASAEEERLISVLDGLTNDVPIDAILRLKSVPWTPKQTKKVAELLTVAGYRCRSEGLLLEVSDPPATITMTPSERLHGKHMSRAWAARIADVLRHIEDYADRQGGGENWCAYRRRRLTLVEKIGTTELDEQDSRFICSAGLPGRVLASRVSMDSRRFGTFAFALAPYHVGGIHPRALIARVRHERESADVFATYASYLWNFHSNRIWLYLIFEDLYAYVGALRASRRYDDPLLPEYWQSLLDLDNTVAELQVQERVDRGDLQSYRPPHARFAEKPYFPRGDTDPMPIEWLRESLIGSSISQLNEDPLEKASTLLERASSQMRESVGLFAETINVRTQGTLQVIQIVFIAAAIGQFLALVPVSQLLALYILARLHDAGLSMVASWIRTNALMDPSVVLVGASNLILLIALTALVLRAVQTKTIRRWMDRVIR